MKRCGKCKETKDPSEFYKDKGTADGKTWQCIECHRKRNKVYRRNNRQKAAQVIYDYKRQRSCVECGESHHAALVFHHVNPEEKRFAISQAGKWAFSNLSVEIEKCIILCSNCHRKFHYIEKKR